MQFTNSDSTLVNANSQTANCSFKEVAIVFQSARINLEQNDLEKCTAGFEQIIQNNSPSTTSNEKNLLKPVTSQVSS